MKYNKVFKRMLEDDDVIRNIENKKKLLLSYDAWKQQIKRSTAHFALNWRLFLSKECSTIDETIFGRKAQYTWCFHSNIRILTDIEKIRICDLNKTTLYKICKKIDKQMLKGRGREARSWYENACSKRLFRFLGGQEIAKIKVQMGMIDPECPVCWETIVLPNDSKFQNLDIFVTRCGHVFCSVCAGRMKHCAMCRCPI